MKVLFDTNIIMDVLLIRQPFFDDSSESMGLAEINIIDGYVCATTITTISYLIARAADKQTAVASIQKLLTLFNIANVNRAVLEDAMRSNFTDFEDAVLYYSGVNAGIDALVTRNPRDFRHAVLPVYGPTDLLALFASDEDDQSSAQNELTD